MRGLLSCFFVLGPGSSPGHEISPRPRQHAAGQWRCDARRTRKRERQLAQAFAYLAVRTLKGLPLTFPTTTGVPRPLTGGVLVRKSDGGSGSPRA